jgi:GABA permease
MAWKINALVVASKTADSDELISHLESRAAGGPIAFTLVVPCGPRSRDTAKTRLEAGLRRMRAAGLDVTGELGKDSDPLMAVHELWDPRRYDEVIVSTLPTSVSRWMRVDLPHRIAKLPGTPVVSHVVARQRTPIPPSPREPALHG